MSDDHAKPGDARSPHVLRRNARRRLLKTIAVAAAGATAVPDKWTKPVLDSVIVPVHAQASGFCAISEIDVAIDTTYLGDANSSQTFDDSGTFGGTFDDDANNDAVGDFLVVAQVPGVPDGTEFDLTVTAAAGTIEPSPTSQDANSSGGVVTFDLGTITDVNSDNALTFTVTGPAGCDPPVAITVTFQDTPA